MAEDTVTVQLSADIEKLTAGMDDAADKVSETMDKIGQSAQEAGEKLDEGIGRGAQQARASLQAMGEDTAGLGEQFNELHSAITTAFEAGGVLLFAEGLEKVWSAMEGAMAAAVNISNMSEALSISTDQFQALTLAADEAGVGMTRVQLAALRVRMALDQAKEGSTAAEEKLLKLGLTSEQVAGGTATVNDVLALMADRLRDVNTAAAEEAAITSDFGARVAPMVISALKNYHGAQGDIAEGSKQQHALNEAEISDLKELQKEWADGADLISNKVKSMTADLLQFRTSVVSMIQESQLAMGAESFAFDSMEGQWEDVATGAKGAADAQSDSAFKVQEAWIKTTKQTVEETKAGTLERVQAEEDYAEALRALYGENNADYKKALDAQAKDIEEMNAKNAEDAVKYGEIQLRAAEKQYSDHKAIVEKFYSETLKDATEYFSTITKEQVDEAQGAEKVALANIDSAQKVLDAQNKMHQIDPSTYLAAEIAYINERRDAEIRMYADIARARQGDKDSAIKAEQDIAVANAKADEQIIAANEKAAQQTADAWKKINSQITSALDSAVDGMLQKTETFQQAMRKLFDQLAIDIINTAINKMVESWLVGEETKLSASTSASTLLKALGLSDAVTAKTTTDQQATASINDSAATGAAAAFASTAAIPIVGPELAPAAAAAADTEILSWIAQIGAQQGGIVPMDMPVNLHQDEMVLPAHISKGIQAQFADLAGAAGGGSGGSSGSNTFHIQAHDAKSFEDYLSKQSNRNAVMKAVNKAMSRGNRGLAGAGNRGSWTS